MIFDNPLLLITLASLFGFCYVRSFISGLIYYMLNKNAYRKRKKGQTFKEWLLYSRFQVEVPKFIRIFYYSILISHPICFGVCILTFFITGSHVVGGVIAQIVVCFWLSIIILEGILFGSPKHRDGPRYDRWIEKKGRNKPRKRWHDKK